MERNIYFGSFAGEDIIFSFSHADTSLYFGNWLRSAQPSADMVTVPASDYESWIREYGMKDDGNSEFGLSIYRATDALAHTGRCMIHGAAFLWCGKAYLLAADSGTGKSTQLRHWTDLYGEDVRIINGDKPILKLEADGKLTVYPSPWKGKEEWGDDSISAPLGGVVLLKQGDENRISRLTPIDCAARILSLIFSTFENREVLRDLCRIEEQLLKTVPVWRLVNKGDRESAMITHDAILQWEMDNGI